MLFFFLSIPITSSYFKFMVPINFYVLVSFCSLLPVLPRCLRHLRPVRQAFGPHVDILLQRAAHLPHHAEFPHRGREPVHPAAPAVDPWGPPVPPRPLRLEQVRLPVRHRPRWVMKINTSHSDSLITHWRCFRGFCASL